MRCATVQCAQDAWFDMAQSSHAMTLDPNPHWVQRYLFLLLSYALRNCAVRTGRRLCSGSGFYSDDAGAKVALGSALFLCLFSDEGAAYAYFCRTEMHEVHKKGRKAAFLFIGPVGKYLTTALLYDTI